MNVPNFKNPRVFFGVPSTGNLGQLTIDLLINMNKAKKVGTIWHEALLPMIGLDPYNMQKKTVSTSNEVYYDKANNTLFIQYRSPVMRKKLTDYIKLITDWLKKCDCSEVIILTGLFNHGRNDAQLQLNQYRYVCNDETISKTYDSGNWLQIETEEDSECPKLSGTGMTRLLYNACKDFVKCSVLLYYCSEGDNVQDSTLFLNKINGSLRLFSNEKKIEFPASWKYFYGNTFPGYIF